MSRPSEESKFSRLTDKFSSLSASEGLGEILSSLHSISGRLELICATRYRTAILNESARRQRSSSSASTATFTASTALTAPLKIPDPRNGPRRGGRVDQSAEEANDSRITRANNNDSSRSL